MIFKPYKIYKRDVRFERNILGYSRIHFCQGCHYCEDLIQCKNDDYCGIEATWWSRNKTQITYHPYAPKN